MESFKSLSSRVPYIGTLNVEFKNGRVVAIEKKK
jgi:hypothetical protein